MSDGWIAIVNPMAGGRRWTPAQTTALRGRVDRICMTDRPGHAADIAAASHDAKGVIVVGGDGTIFEVLQRMDLPRQRLMILPTGRGNSLARDLGVQARAVDLMRVTFVQTNGQARSVWSASTVAVGYPVEVGEAADDRFRRLRGGAYAAAAVVRRPRRFPLGLSYGDAVRAACLTGWLATNTRHVANFLAAAGADCGDGRFEVLELAAGYFRQGLHNIAALARQTYGPVTPRPVNKAHLTFDEPRTLLIDGERFRSVQSVDVRIARGAVTCARVA